MLFCSWIYLVFRYFKHKTTITGYIFVECLKDYHTFKTRFSCTQLINYTIDVSLVKMVVTYRFGKLQRTL